MERRFYVLKQQQRTILYICRLKKGKNEEGPGARTQLGPRYRRFISMLASWLVYSKGQLMLITKLCEHTDSSNRSLQAAAVVPLISCVGPGQTAEEDKRTRR